MSIAPVSNTTGATSTDGSTSTATAAAPSLDKEAFLKLLMAQLRNQDPLSPMDSTQFVSQLAAFSTVEQAIAQNEKLQLLSVQMSGLASNAATSLVGQRVTVRGNKVAFDGQNATGFNVNLGAAATEVTVTIRDAAGKVVRTMQLGPKAAGTVASPWDGRDDNGTTVAAGSYTVEVSARDESGNPVTITQDVSGTVVGVNFEHGYPELVLDSGATAPISDLVSVGTAAPPATP